MADHRNTFRKPMITDTFASASGKYWRQSTYKLYSRNQTLADQRNTFRNPMITDTFASASGKYLWQFTRLETLIWAAIKNALRGGYRFKSARRKNPPAAQDSKVKNITLIRAILPAGRIFGCLNFKKCHKITNQIVFLCSHTVLIIVCRLSSVAQNRPPYGIDYLCTAPAESTDSLLLFLLYPYMYSVLVPYDTDIPVPVICRIRKQREHGT